MGELAQEGMELLGMDGGIERWGGLPCSEAGFPQGCHDFLADSYVAETCALLRIKPELTEAARQAAAELIRHRPALRLAWHCRARLFANSGSWAEFSAWPALREKRFQLFYFLVLLGCVPELRQRQGKLGIPEQVTLDTLSDLETWAEDFHDKNGYWGFANLNWLLWHFQSKLFRLGRLQFAFDTLACDLCAFRHRQTGKITLLAENGLRFRPDGQYANADGVEHPEPWTSTLEKTTKGFSGHAFSPDGCALREPVLLEASLWDEILRPGDPVLGVHIPALGPMDPEACQDSFRQAREFFPRYFPRQRARAFSCISWLLDGQFAKLLPESSNIRAFLANFQPFPIPGANQHQTYDRVFSSQELPANPKTSLQKIIAAHANAGGRWRCGGGLAFADEL